MLSEEFKVWTDFFNKRKFDGFAFFLFPGKAILRDVGNAERGMGNVS